MAARATRSASRKARVAEAVATGPLAALSHDELGVIFDGLADPVQPVVAVALSSTCLGLRTPLRAALEVLAEQHMRVINLCPRFGLTCAELREAVELDCSHSRLTAAEVATLGMILRSNSLDLSCLDLSCLELRDAGLQALCEGLDHGCVPSICSLSIQENRSGPAGAEALAAALRRGAMPKLEALYAHGNPIGNQGMTALAPALRKRPALAMLSCWEAGIGDEAVASLVDNLGKDEFKKLEELDLDYNDVTDVGCAKLVSAIKAGAMPCLRIVYLEENDKVSEEAYEALRDALAANEAASASPGLLAHEIPLSSAGSE